jgi:putative flippase GtrA
MSSNNLSDRDRLSAESGVRVVKFIFAGLANTGSTYLLYLLLLFVWNYQISYAVSYAAGIALAFFLNSRLVFRTKFSIVRMFIYPLIYIFQYLANAALLELFVVKLGILKQIAPLIAICLTMPVVYFLNKIVLTSFARKRPAGEA